MTRPREEPTADVPPEVHSHEVDADDSTGNEQPDGDGHAADVVHDARVELDAWRASFRMDPLER